MQCILKKMNKNTEIKHPKLDYSFNQQPITLPILSNRSNHGESKILG